MRAGRRGCRNPCGGVIRSVSAAEITPWSNGASVYVGGVALTSTGGAIVYATTDTSGNVITEGATAANCNIMWDGSTLTLNGAKIKGDTSSGSLGATVGIYAFNSSGNVSLNIVLQDNNEITSDNYGIWVYSPNNGGNASLSIEGSGSLNASGFQNGIQVQSNSNNATLTIQNADVTATSACSDGVRVLADADKSASLTVDGGSLTASGSAGICFDFGNENNSGTASLTVGGNALVDTRNSGIDVYGQSNVTTTADDNVTNGGIVFDGDEGTVYGDVTLQDDLTVGKDESLTISDGAKLTIPDDKTLTVNGGTITGNVSGDVTYKVTGVSLNTNELTLTEGTTGTLTATVTPDNATNQNVTWTSSNTTVARVENGVVTAASAGEAIITVTTADGGKTDTCTVTVTSVPEPEEPEEAYIPSTPIPDGFHEYSLGTMLYIDGKRVKGLYESEGATYFFNEQGFMQTGWVEFAEGWRYFAEDGKMVTGWLQIGNAWYYLAPETGIMFDDGLHTIGKSTYYFYDWGGMASDWWYEDEAGDWYFFGGSGAMKAAQWLEWKGDWYYLTETGRMAVDTTVGGYYVNASGVWAG